MKKLSYLVWLFVTFNFYSVHCFAQVIRAFEFDGCTLYKEGTQDYPKLWEHCCFQHDLRFWAGGTKSQRIEADKSLKSCVAKTGASTHSFLIYMGVTLGSLSPYKLKGRQWGNAWSDKVRDQELNSDEINQLKQSLIEQQLLSDFQIKEFIKSLENAQI